MSGKDTKFFYDSIAKSFLDEVAEEMPVAYFDVRTYEKYVNNTDKVDDTKLIGLYKILSPAHLLKQPFINDSNSLDTKFYVELLHIIGLEEIKDGGKKLIKRKAKSDEAFLLENTIIKLEDKDALRNISNLSTFGANKEEQLFNVALELCITWVNRVLFIKLLEAQLYKYHKGNKDYLFLNSKLVFDFDELSNLFFQVLAEKPESRRNHIQEKFSKVPYLNSSLFERMELERQTINISELDNRLQLPVSNSSVLKDDKGKRKAGTLPTLQYLFEFLDAYDFTSEGGEEIQEENKNLINASVLGLIFEKINGYKDGSFFTPGFVTMYMCKETIRRSVLQKFNDTKGWNCDTIDGLYNKIDDKKDANKIINSLHICDPAVGSGHFLVSALNEMIAIKSELKILQDATGKSLRDYHVEVVNDELIITDEDGKLFDYNPQNKESQRIQETLFHEKETIIENCLFGVDINPNSVKICRLRLWIELLKNAYYIAPSPLERAGGEADIVTLNYAMLRAPEKTTLPAGPWKELKFDLTGNMNRYVWSLDNKVVSESDKILIRKGENIRIILFNNSMMRHPMHLHGHDFRLLSQQGEYAIMKNIIDIMPMEKDTLEFAANERGGDWFFHCHILYHMMSGMGRVFSYDNPLVDKTDITDPKLARRRLNADDRRFHLMGRAALESNGSEGEFMLAQTRWRLSTLWHLGFHDRHGYESETMLGRYIGRNQWLFPYVGFDYHFKKEGGPKNLFGNEDKNWFGQTSNKTKRATIVAGVAYTLPLLFIADARVDGNGKFRFQLGREDIPITSRLRFAMMVNTDKEYMAGFRYIVTKYINLSTHYDSDMGIGAGITITY